MTDEDFRAMIKQRIDDSVKMSEKQFDMVYEFIRDLHKKVDIIREELKSVVKYQYMIIGVVSFLVVLIPIAAAIIAKL